MLTADLVKPRLQTRGKQLSIRYLPHTDEWRQMAIDLINLLYGCVGEKRSVWQSAVTDYEGVRVDFIVIRGLAKVLTDGAKFEPINSIVDPAELRQLLFSAGPTLGRPRAGSMPAISSHECRQQRLDAAADSLGTTTTHLDQTLYADRPSNHILRDIGENWTADTLIARYNLELARAALYWADQMSVELFDHFKDFWKYVKLFKLMFWAEIITPETDPPNRRPSGYSITLDGPISPFVKSTTRYGRQLAAFLPALFLCDQWQMSASIRHPQTKQNVSYHLDHTSNLQSHFKDSGPYDSKLEADFAAEFEAKFGNERGHWRLDREDEVIVLGDSVMIPDFSFTHKKDGRRALVEIMGFWHPNYLKRKLYQLQKAQRHDLIIVVYEKLNLTADKLVDIPSQVLYFKTKPVLKEVVSVVEKVAI